MGKAEAGRAGKAGPPQIIQNLPGREETGHINLRISRGRCLWVGLNNKKGR